MRLLSWYEKLEFEEGLFRHSRGGVSIEEKSRSESLNAL
jgi:hypothetical protein